MRTIDNVRCFIHGAPVALIELGYRPQKARYYSQLVFHFKRGFLIQPMYTPHISLTQDKTSTVG